MGAGLVVLVVGVSFAALPAFGQAGTGTITGVVTDPQGAAVLRAGIEARNANTGQVYSAASSTQGNYTVTQLPPGIYELTVRVDGFKTAIHENLQVQAAETLRLDVALEVGSAAELVTVASRSSLLRTESGDLAYHFTGDDMVNLPLLGIGVNAGSSGIRNPYNVAGMMPGVDYSANLTMLINGTPNNSSSYRVEGQDMTNHFISFALQEEQPGADAIQEVAVQTSNYAPEYGTAGGAVFNITMRSGGNQYHGGGFEYFVNEDLNAGQPFSIDSAGHKYRPLNRRNDYGGTLGGPIRIPKVYDGRNRTFFFFNWEQYLESLLLNINNGTLPVPDYRNGDFSAISPNGTCSLCSAYGIPRTPLGTPTTATDALGRQFFANTVYDPATRAVNSVNQLGYANPFQGNVIPATRFDPITVKLQAMLPQAQSTNLTQNYAPRVQGIRTTTIPSLKLDQSGSAKDKLSFYWSTTGTEAQYTYPTGGADGLPAEISAARGSFVHSRAFRLNYDRTVTPTLLFHAGAGFQWLLFADDAPFQNFDPTSFGISGFQAIHNFPSFSGMTSALYGGMQNFGVSAQSHQYQQRPTYNMNITKVRGSHTYKGGSEVFFQGTINRVPATVAFVTGSGPTSQPFTPTVSFNNFTTGFGYASWLLGDYGAPVTNASTQGITQASFNGITQSPAQDYRQGKAQWALFAQDSWKVTRKLTLDYGLRWDLGTAVKEEYGRVGELDPAMPNANAGGHPGATMYAATCACSFYRGIYPYAFGPRVGVAYQVAPRTVLRGGWGVVYQFTTDTGASTVSSPGTYPLVPINPFVNIETPGALLQPAWPVFNPNVYPNQATLTGVPSNPDRNFNRPPRLNQYSFSIQHEFARDFLVESSYVGNRDVWLPNGPLGFLSQLSPALYAHYGLHPYTVYSDFQLLGQSIGSTAVEQKMAANGVGNGGLLLPYSGFSSSAPLKNVLYPFPQFGAISPGGSPTGKSYYNSLQVKAIKRLSHGLVASATYTWSKNEVLNTRQDFFNPASSQTVLTSTNQPEALSLAVVYTTPKATSNRWIRVASADWQLSAAGQYASAFMLIPPTNPTSNLLSSEYARVPGVPLYNKDPNCHCINPWTDQVLNPNAWQVVGTNQVGPALNTLYSDFRGPRHPQENFSLGRNIRVKEHYNLQVRAEFVNIFNRVYLPAPFTTGTPLTNLTHGGANGQLTAGFGTMPGYAAVNSYPNLGGLPRTGTLIARFSF